MSVVPAPSRPSLSVDTIPSVVERHANESMNCLLTPTLIPEVVINGKKHDPQSYQRPHKSSTTSSATSSVQEDGWGSNFWVTLVDPQVCRRLHLATFATCEIEYSDKYRILRLSSNWSSQLGSSCWQFCASLSLFPYLIIKF
jgi:hypothetical protein